MSPAGISVDPFVVGRILVGMAARGSHENADQRRPGNIGSASRWDRDHGRVEPHPAGNPGDL